MNTINIKEFDLNNLKIGSTKVVNGETFKKIYYNSHKFVIKLPSCKISSDGKFLKIKPNKVDLDIFASIEGYIFKNVEKACIDNIKYDTILGPILYIKYDNQNLCDKDVYDIYIRPNILVINTESAHMVWKVTEAFKQSNPLFIDEPIDELKNIVNEEYEDMNNEIKSSINIGLYMDEDHNQSKKIKDLMDRKMSYIQKHYKLIITKIKKMDIIDAMEITTSLEQHIKDLTIQFKL